ncbi:MAG: nuclear transport factor 2 family protein [Pseudomonadota bacterium]|nr:nuclear transport factor 2 family protein [Pseudomonadota bacterium]
MKKPLLLTLAALTFALCLNTAQADEASDREEIHALLWKYTRTLDTLNADAYVSVFTEDGALKSGSTSLTQGHDALRAMVEGVKKGQDERAAAGNPSGPMYHMTMDSFIEFVDADHARHHSYWQTVFGPAKPGDPVRIAAAGYGIDELVRVDGTWLIKLRDVAAQ